MIEQKQENLKKEEEKPRERELATSEIYVMPEKFRPQVKKGGGGKIVFIIGILVIVSLLIAGAIVLFTTNLQREKTLTRAPANAPVNVPKNVNAPVKKEEPARPPANVNEAAPAEETVNAPLNINAPAEPTLPTPEPLPLSLDTDNDNLTDIEEALYGTMTNRPDTDGDGYIDGLEVANLYNPAGTAPVRLRDSGLISLYQNPLFDYQIFYPKEWLARSIDQTNKEVIFSSATGEFIQVIMGENPRKLGALEWYLEQSPGVDRESLENIENDFFEGVRSPDGLTVYLISKKGAEDLVYIVTYNIGTRTELNFKTTFEMMIKSLSPKGQEVE